MVGCLPVQGIFISASGRRSEVLTRHPRYQGLNRGRGRSWPTRVAKSRPNARRPGRRKSESSNADQPIPLPGGGFWRESEAVRIVKASTEVHSPADACSPSRGIKWGTPSPTVLASRSHPSEKRQSAWRLTHSTRVEAGSWPFPGTTQTADSRAQWNRATRPTRMPTVGKGVSGPAPYEASLLLEGLCGISRDCSVDWEILDPYGLRPIGFIRGGVCHSDDRGTGRSRRNMGEVLRRNPSG